MRTSGLARVCFALAVIALCWAGAVAWLTVADPRHREFYAGPGVHYEVRDAGSGPSVFMPAGSYFGWPVPGLHAVTVGVLAAAGIGLVAAGRRLLKRSDPPADPS
jgi:hypothetical protein